MDTNKSGIKSLSNELKQFEKAAETGDFKIILSEENMIGSDSKIIHSINKYLNKYRKAVEYDIMKYKLTSDALSIALWDMDIVVEDPVSPNNKFTWSQEFRQMLGFKDKKDFPDLLHSWSDRLHPEDKERTLDAFAAHITDLTGKTPYDIEYRLMMKTGEYRYFHAYGNTQRSVTGIPLRVAGALMDITNKTEMAEALQEALNEAKSANNAKSEFLANMSHEMRTPLNAIIGLTGLSMDDNSVNEETRQHLENVREAGITLLGLVNDLLDVSASGSDFNEENMHKVKLEHISIPYAHVLVVDDNFTNLDVAKGLLKPYGMKIACVDSGQKAIDAVKTLDGRFCAIFMDQMMPDMDGIETVAAIRALNTEYTKSVPIIALTANVASGNEEMLLNKGFQAFLPKPIDVFRLDAVIRQWIRDKEKEKEYFRTEIPDQNPVDPNINKKSILYGKQIEGLNIDKGIKRFGGQEDPYIEILRAYSKNTKKILATIDSYPEEIKNYVIIIHGLKGSNYSICADESGDFAKTLEEAAKAGDWDYVIKNNPLFIERSYKFISAIDEILPPDDSEKNKTEKDKPDETILTKLRTACDEYDMDGIDEAMEEITEFKYNSDEGLADWLQENVDQMNFSEIVEKLNALR